MKSLLRVGLLGATALFSLSVAANAVTIQVNSTSPSWMFTGGTNTNTKTSTPGDSNSTVWQIFWGNSTGSGQSGLGFNPAQPPSFNATPGTLFDLGTLFHYNNPITGDTP